MSAARPDAAPLLVFDFAEGPGLPPRRRVFRAPLEVLEARAPGEVPGVLARVEQAAREEGLWAGGWVSYEAAPAFDPALEVAGPARLPLAWFALFRAPEEGGVLPAPGPAHFAPWVPGVDAAGHRAGVEAVREAIARGETYQLNLTLRLRSRLTGDARGAWERMAAAQGGPYAAFLSTGRHHVLSASPELFFRREGRRLVTRPMKGTARRGRWEEEDAAVAAALAASPKERAENAMIVDLLRNDLGRVAEVGSVRVPHLFTPERYRTVWQLTSTVEARAREGVGLADLFGALFPCGSVTGAPKVATMALTRRLEGAPREVYCGTVGLVEPGGDATFSVAIRTAWVDAASGEAEYGTGGGVTWDSTPLGEHQEALAKAALLTEGWPPFRLLETLRLTAAGEYTLLARHLSRLASSARFLGVPLGAGAAEAALASHAAAHRGAERRVRLLVDGAGAVEVESAPLQALPPGPLPVALARAPVSRHDRSLFHKTTHREAYVRAREGAPEAAFDVVLWNAEGELTELTTGNLVVEGPDGRRRTPAREGGLLAGTLREELLAAGEVEEAVLPREALQEARRLWLVNSVRGWVEVALLGAGR